jgi:NAD+ kinase
VYERLAVAGGDTDADAEVEAEVEAAVERAGGELVSTDRANAVVAVGEDALVGLVDAGRPVLAVGVDGVPSVGRDGLEAALSALVEGRCRTVRRPLLGVTGAGHEAVALFDVALFAAEPGRISEFALDRDGDRLATVRADGLVAATPAGSHGYARAAGGPTLGAGTGVVAVVPVAPFSASDATGAGVGAAPWVLDPARVALSVARDEVAVRLVVDGHTAGRVPVGRPLRLEATGGLSMLLPGGSDHLESL